MIKKTSYLTLQLNEAQQAQLAELMVVTKSDNFSKAFDRALWLALKTYKENEIKN